ncbi:MAG: hypothetical protein COT14_00185 [Candidatus Diapherotrites archaeon CG08_land_8_20_14_0_20_30_16]|nr:MAG: hypothetical protein COT14_00185 [Candidatus Diapherotrites archaeon CG08_land_8_20_14_0_20_30_16]
MVEEYTKSLGLLKEYDDLIKKQKSITQRVIYTKIKSKIDAFLEKGGLNIISLIGLRGTGKTTILNTIAKEYDTLYTSGDFLSNYSIALKELIKIYSTLNKRIIIIDEITYIDNWQDQLKIWGDVYQKFLFIISSSSALNLKELSADISRRLDIYKIEPLSFSEYLFIVQNISLNAKEKLFDAIFKINKNEDRYNKLNKISLELPFDLYKYFEDYKLRQFPFLLNENNTLPKIKEVIDKVIYKDISKLDNLYSENLTKIETILRFLAVNEKTNYDNISKNTGLKRDIVEKIFGLLISSQLIFFVRDVIPTKIFKTTKKILFNIPSLRFSLDQIHMSSIIGFGREDYFAFVIRNLNLDIAYNYKQNGYDYLVAGVKFEIGNNKTALAKDVVVVGDFLNMELKNNVLYIPFYLFALLID